MARATNLNEAWELKVKPEVPGFLAWASCTKTIHLTIAGPKSRMSSIIELSVKCGGILKNAVELVFFYITISSSTSGEA